MPYRPSRKLVVKGYVEVQLIVRLIVSDDRETVMRMSYILLADPLLVKRMAAYQYTRAHGYLRILPHGRFGTYHVTSDSHCLFDRPGVLA